MNAGVQTKQAAKEMVPETVNEQQQTGKPEDGSAVLIQALKDQGCRSHLRLPWRGRITDLRCII